MPYHAHTNSNAALISYGLCGPEIAASYRSEAIDRADGKVELEDICGEVCTDDVKVSERPIHKLYHDLVAALETVILHLLEQTPDNDMPILHIVFSDRDGNTSHAWWQCICHWKAHASHKFEAVLMSYLVSSVEPGEQPSHPYEIQVRQPTRLGWQGFNADVFRSVALHLALQHWLQL